ncbi:MAG TPA: hypothetical protein VN253_02270, partial [Kofleriaceae bacterium]|nr:hypothetical protein [Kofleriaceae bacterium]
MNSQHPSILRPLYRAVSSVLVVALLAPPVAYAQPAPEKPPTSPQPQDDPTYKCGKQTGPVAVNFKPETELKEIIAWVMGFTCRNYILDPRIVSTGKKVTIMAPLKMSQADAYAVFLAALSTMGLTVVPKGNVFRIVESSTAKSETVPIYKQGVPPNQDQIIRYILRPSNTSTETLRQALDAVRSPAGSVSVAGNLLIITDYASQVRDMMSLARAIDVPGNTDGIYTIPIKYSDATQLATKLNEILGISGGAGGPGKQMPGGGRMNPNVPP